MKKDRSKFVFSCLIEKNLIILKFTDLVSTADMWIKILTFLQNFEAHVRFAYISMKMGMNLKIGRDAHSACNGFTKLVLRNDKSVGRIICCRLHVYT